MILKSTPARNYLLSLEAGREVHLVHASVEKKDLSAEGDVEGMRIESFYQARRDRLI